MNQVQIKAQCELLIEELMQQANGIQAAIVSTADGFELASRVNNAAQTDRLAAMSSSISALGQVVGQESQLGNSRSILIEADRGFLAVIHSNSPEFPMTLSIVAGADAVVGQVLFFGKQTAQALGRLA